jgi:hypothetical protein
MYSASTLRRAATHDILSLVDVVGYLLGVLVGDLAHRCTLGICVCELHLQTKEVKFGRRTGRTNSGKTWHLEEFMETQAHVINVIETAAAVAGSYGRVAHI